MKKNIIKTSFVGVCTMAFIVFFALTTRVDAAFGSAEADSLFGTYPETTASFLGVNIQALSQQPLTKEINRYLNKNTTAKIFFTDLGFWQRMEKAGLTPKSVPYFYMIQKSKYESRSAQDMVIFVRTDISTKEFAKKLAGVLAPAFGISPLDICIEKDTQGSYFYKVVNNAAFEKDLTEERIRIQFKNAPQPGFVMIAFTETSFDWLKKLAPKTQALANTNWLTTRGTFDKNTLYLNVRCTRRQQMILQVAHANKQTVAFARYRMETPKMVDEALNVSNEEMPSILTGLIMNLKADIKPKNTFSRFNTHTIQVQEIIPDATMTQTYIPAIIKALH